MLYTNILQKSYTLAIRNPVFWLFGFVMLGGFNLYLVNFFTLVPSEQWQVWSESFGLRLHSHPTGFLAAILAAVAIFVILNLVKIIFIVVVHKFLHTEKIMECDLCVRNKSQAEGIIPTPLPYFVWLIRVMIASILTIALTLGITLAINTVLSAQGYNSLAAVIINLLFVAVVTCVIGTWNVFTGYFIVLHGLRFEAASSAAVDLITKHARRVAEFVILLSIIYTLAVLIGNAFFYVLRFASEVSSFVLLRLLFMAISVLWFAISNAFFNIAFLIFFDKTVKSIPAEQSHGHLASNSLN